MRMSDWSADVCSSDLADIAARHLGLHPFRRGDIPLAPDLAARAAERTDRGEPIVRALMEGLKQERFILPSADTLERAGIAGRARARQAEAALLVESLGHAELARIDDRSEEHTSALQSLMR